MKRPFALMLLAGVFLSACGPAGGGGQSPSAIKEGGTLRVAQAEEDRTLDPLKSSQFVERLAYYNMYESLVQIDDKLTIKPLLATQWETPDPKTYVFKLRTGIKFHDGTDFNAQTVKFNIDRILTAATSPRKAELRSVDAVEVKDPTTVIIHLKNPDATLLSQLVDRAGMILSPTAVQKGGAEFERNPVGAGTGPFQFVEWKRDDHITLKKNPNYWRQGLPHLDEIIFRPIVNSDAMLAALQTGDLDVAERIAEKDIARVKTDPNLIYRSVSAIDYDTIVLNHISGPFVDPAKRMAIALAVDRSQILKNVLFNIGSVSYGPIPPPSWAFDPNEKIFDRADPDTAKATATGFSFTLKTTPRPNAVQEAQLIQSQLAKAGITVTIQQQEFGQLLTEVEGQKFEAALLGWSGRIDPDGNMYGQFHSKGGLNDGKYSNPRVDKLLDDARTTLDQSKRKELYQEAQKILVQDVARVFLTHSAAAQETSNKVHNYPLIADRIYRFAEVWKG